MFLLLITALVSVIALRPRFYLTSVPSLVFWVPLLTHLYALFVGLVSGVIFNPPVLLAVSLVMIAIALYLHRPTIQHILSILIKSPSTA